MTIHNVNILEFKLPDKGDYVIFLSSEFCQPCKEVMKKIENTDISIDIYKIMIDTNDEDEIEQSYELFNMKNIPTLIKYNNSNEIIRSVGLNECLDNFYTIFTSEIKDNDDF